MTSPAESATGQRLINHLDRWDMDHPENPVSPLVRSIGRLVAGRLGEEGSGTNQYIGIVESVAHDVASGVDSATGEPIDPRLLDELTGSSEGIDPRDRVRGTGMSLAIAFGGDFAHEVTRIYGETYGYAVDQPPPEPPTTS